MGRVLYWITGWFIVAYLWRGVASIFRFWFACARFGRRLGGG